MPRKLSERLDALPAFSTQENPGITKNLAYAVVAQGVAFLSSILMSLVVPKMLGVEDYAYWQMFTLYASYTGIALFGINDGIYLRLGGSRYGELDKGEVKAQLMVVAAFQAALATLCIAVLLGSGLEGERLRVFLCVVAIGFLANNFSCLSYVFQSCNLTQIASIAALVNRVLFLLALALLVLPGVDSYLPIVFAYIACQLVALLYCLICAREIARIKCGSLRIALRDCSLDARSGIKIMISYHADLLIVGFTRMITDWHLGLETFGKLSFSFSLVNFALGFIAQFALVVFPVLKRLDETSKREKYLEIRSALHCFLPVAYVGYVPVLIVLGWWLPDYRESLTYLALVLPLCFYSCKSNVLFTTYFKMNRDETMLAVVNVIAMAVNAALSFAAVVLVGSVEIASVGIVVSVMARDCAFEAIMSKRYDVPFVGDCAVEALLAAVFMASSWFMGVWSFLPVACVLALYWYLDREQFVGMVRAMGARFGLGRRNGEG